MREDRTGPGRAGGPVRAVDLALVLVGALIVVLVAVEVVLVHDSGYPSQWVIQGFPAVAAVYAATGLLAWHRRPGNRMGVLMVLGSLVWLVAGAANTLPGPLVAAGLVGATIPLAVIVHLLLAFPSGRLGTPAARVTAVAGYGVSTILQAPFYLFVEGVEPPPFDVLAVWSRPDLLNSALNVQRALGALVMLATSIVLFRRWRGAAPQQRRIVAPLSSFGIVTVLSFPLSSFIQDVFSIDIITMVSVQLVAAAVVPVAFTVAVLRGGFARTGDLEELGAWLGADRFERPDLVAALAAAIGDPSVDLVYWVPTRDTYVTTDGMPVARPAPTADRGVVDIELDDRRVAAITYDATLIADPDLVTRAGRVVALAVDRERLMAELRSSREALRQSLARVVEAGDHERRRIARDLHDGIQAQLVLLALQARQLDGGDALGAAIDGSAADLRNLVHGVMPALLVERGLFAAVEDLVDRVPVPVIFRADGSDDGLPPAVEGAAYFVVAEAVSNAVKHAGAEHVEVALVRDGAELAVEVGDDGRGGAVAGEGRGSGLIGMADRVRGLGGRLVVDSPVGRGTRVRAEVPCAS